MHMYSTEFVYIYTYKVFCHTYGFSGVINSFKQTNCAFQVITGWIRKHLQVIQKVITVASFMTRN